MRAIAALLAPLAVLGNVPQTTPPREVVQPLPPSNGPPGDFSSGQPPPLPQLPPKMDAWHVQGAFFPESIFDRPADNARKPPPDNSEMDPRPGGRWLHTCVELDNTVVCYGGVTNAKTLLNDVWLYSPLRMTWDFLDGQQFLSQLRQSMGRSAPRRLTQGSGGQILRPSLEMRDPPP